MVKPVSQGNEATKAGNSNSVSDSVSPRSGIITMIALGVIVGTALAGAGALGHFNIISALHPSHYSFGLMGVGATIVLASGLAAVIAFVRSRQGSGVPKQHGQSHVITVWTYNLGTDRNYCLANGIDDSSFREWELTSQRRKAFRDLFYSCSSKPDPKPDIICFQDRANIMPGDINYEKLDALLPPSLCNYNCVTGDDNTLILYNPNTFIKSVPIMDGYRAATRLTHLLTGAFIRVASMDVSRNERLEQVVDACKVDDAGITLIAGDFRASQTDNPSRFGILKNGGYVTLSAERTATCCDTNNNNSKVRHDYIFVKGQNCRIESEKVHFTTGNHLQPSNHALVSALVKFSM